MLFLALLAGVGAFFNYYAVTTSVYSLFFATILQVVFLFLTITALFSYRGRHSRPSYDGAGYPILTVPYALISISFVGNLSILIVFILNLSGYISAF